MNWGISRLFWGDNFLNHLIVFLRPLDAGRKRGSIKKSHHVGLVEAIELAAQQVGQNILSPIQQVEKAKNKTKAVKSAYEQLEEDYEKLLEKCNSLLLENFELKKRIFKDTFF